MRFAILTAITLALLAATAGCRKDDADAPDQAAISADTIPINFSFYSDSSFSVAGDVNAPVVLGDTVVYRMVPHGKECNLTVTNTRADVLVRLYVRDSLTWALACTTGHGIDFHYTVP